MVEINWINRVSDFCTAVPVIFDRRKKRVSTKPLIGLVQNCLWCGTWKWLLRNPEVSLRNLWDYETFWKFHKTVRYSKDMVKYYETSKVSCDAFFPVCFSIKANTYMQLLSEQNFEIHFYSFSVSILMGLGLK